MKLWLLDTGPLVAYLDRDQPEHIRTIRGLGEFSGQLCTTSAVITEAMYFVRGVPDGPGILAEFIEVTRTLVYDYTQPVRLKSAAALMEKYSDTPMDFADATLVLLAGELKITEIATFDRRGFLTYRTVGGKPFRLAL
ncbi:MAG TPA: PIN domain-containing protein [Acidobacteriota bacterium]|jgi:hypothetical protein|nr:PIN domain-containing protein [Acidobacteriota bacterium]